MTIDELKAGAKEHGYTLVKQKKYERVIPIEQCVCGRKRLKVWYGIGRLVICTDCGKKGPDCASEREARIKWNEMIKAEKENSK